MTDLTQYEALIADWRQKENTLEILKEFAATGGEHRLKVSVVNADPVLSAICSPILNEMMKGKGWAKVVSLAVDRAELEARRAHLAIESAALHAAEERVSS